VCKTFTAPCFLISNFCRVLNVVYFLLGNSPASEFYMPTFRDTLSVPSSWADRYPPMKMEQTECSETSAHKIQTPGNYPEESIRQLVSYLSNTTTYFQFKYKYSDTSANEDNSFRNHIR